MNKKIITFAAALFITLGAMATVTPADANSDGVVNESDAALIYSYILGTASDDISLAQVDVNGDGKVNTIDVVAVYLYIKNKSDDELTGGAPDSDDSEFSAPAQRRGTWGNLWSE